VSGSRRPNIIGRSYKLTAEVEVPEGGGDGMIVTSGGRWGGWGLYMPKGKPVFDYNMLVLAQYRREGPDALTSGKHTIDFDYTYDGPGVAKGGTGIAADGEGTVEKISIRSVSLRSAEDSIVTVPYGQIGTIENFSREWVTETFSFRVPFETDIQHVLALFNRIGEDMARDPDLAFGFLQPLRGTGISDVGEGTLVLKAEFTAKPGRQSAICRAALQAVQLGFRESGIQTVPGP
jgi:small-conductance mechanosensitive channel